MHAENDEMEKSQNLSLENLSNSILVRLKDIGDEEQRW